MIFFFVFVSNADSLSEVFISLAILYAKVVESNAVSKVFFFGQRMTENALLA